MDSVHVSFIVYYAEWFIFIPIYLPSLHVISHDLEYLTMFLLMHPYLLDQSTPKIFEFMSDLWSLFTQKIYLLVDLRNLEIELEFCIWEPTIYGELRIYDVTLNHGMLMTRYLAASTIR